MAWDHGYYTQETYPPDFHQEMSPNWLDFAALVKGVRPPRAREGAPFRYLELGSGMGFGLCLLAALYPEGQFLGTDFQPDHIAHSRQLAEAMGLKNIRFKEADFLDLASDPSPLGLDRNDEGIYHYVAAHGIVSWVSEPVRRALLAVASRSVRTGGLVYLSYNCQPGWLGMGLFRDLVHLELTRGDSALPGQAFERASRALQALLGDEQKPTALAQMLPLLRNDLAETRTEDFNYLLGEYGSEHWQPMPVADMHQLCREYKLSPVSTATLAELFEELLPEPLRSQVRLETNPRIRETLIDMGTAKCFRRDLFTRGAVRLSTTQWRQRLGAIRLRLKETPERSDWTFTAAFGELAVAPEICIALENALGAGPRSLLELADAIGQPPVEIVRLASLLLHEHRIGLERGQAGQEAGADCDRINRLVLQRIGEGWPYQSLAAASVGSSVDLGTIEALLCLAPGQGPITPADAAWVEDQLRELRGPETPAAQPGGENRPSRGETIRETASVFQRHRLPSLKPLGVVLDRFHRSSTP